MAMDIKFDKVNEFFKGYIRDRKAVLCENILWGHIIDTGRIKWAIVSTMRDVIIVTHVSDKEATTYMADIEPDFKRRREICITSPNYEVIIEAGFIGGNGHYLIRQNDNQLYDIFINGDLFKRDVTYLYALEFVFGINTTC